MESSQFSLQSLLIVTVLALIVPLVVSRIKWIRLPIVVGEILVGVIVGKSGFNVIQPSEWLQFLQFFGLAYLMFVSGLEVDFHALRPNASEGRGIGKWIASAPVFGALTCALTFGLSYALATWLYARGFISSPLLFALILTTTSLTVVVPVLKEYNLLTTRYGQLLLAAAVFADFATMLLISVAASVFQGGLSPSILLVLVLGFALVAVYVIFKRFSGLHGAFRSLAHGTAQLGIRGAFALMIVFLVLAQTLGVQVILGTFLAGILVGLISEHERASMQHKLDAIGFGFFIPIFFIMVGVNFNLRTLFADPHALLLIPILLVATYVFKGLPTLALRFKYPWRQTLAGAFLLTTQMSVTVAATAVGVRVGAISEGVGTAIILVAMLTSIISPVTFGKLLPTTVFKPRDKTVIIGATPEAQLLVEHIRHREGRCESINDTSTLEQINEENLSTVWADLGIDAQRTKALVAYTNDDRRNLCLAKMAAQQSIPTVVCNLRDLQLYHEHRNSEEFHAVHPQLSVIHFIDQLIHYPVSTQMMESPEHIRVAELTLRHRRWSQYRVMDLNLPGNLLILAIFRDGIEIIPHGDTKFQTGDTVMVVGIQEDIEEFRRLTLPDTDL